MLYMLQVGGTQAAVSAVYAVWIALCFFAWAENCWAERAVPKDVQIVLP